MCHQEQEAYQDVAVNKPEEVFAPRGPMVAMESDSDPIATTELVPLYKEPPQQLATHFPLQVSEYEQRIESQEQMVSALKSRKLNIHDGELEAPWGMILIM